MTATVTTRARRAVVLAAALVATSCGGGSDEAAPSATDAPATTAPADTTVPDDGPVETTDGAAAEPVLLVASSSSASGDVSLTIESSEGEIWATTERDDICSPAEPAVAVLEAELDGDRADDIDRLVAFFERADDEDDEDDDTSTTSTTEPDRDGPSVEFARGDDGAWAALVGPIEARNRNDRPMTVRVVAYGGRAAVVEAELGLTVLAPVRCDDGETSRRRLPDPVDLDVSTRPAAGMIVGAEVDDCAGRPTRLAVDVEASGAVVAMTVTGTTTDGSSVVKALDGRGGSNFTVTLGPFASPPVGDTASLLFAVEATDVYGTTATDTVTATIVRPEPCDDPDVPVDTTMPDEPGDQPGVSFSPDPIEIDAAAAGTCPTRPTTIAVTITGVAAATSVTASARTVSGNTVETVLIWQNGAWRGTLGPIAGAANMPASSSLDVRITVVVDGETRTFDRSGLLRRPAACATTTAAPTTTTTTTTPAPTTTTTAPTTTTTTTTTPPPQVTNANANPNPVACGQNFRFGAQTSGTVDRVIANYGGGQVTLSRNGGIWQSSPLSVPNPGTYPITVNAGDTATGRTDSATFQLQVTDTGSC